MMSSSDSSDVDPQLIISHQFPETTLTYTERDVALYALGVGACTRDALDDKELKYVYHKDGESFIQVLPTFAALFPFRLVSNIEQLPGLQFDPRLLLHGQQYIEIYRPLPSSGSIRNKAEVAGLHDKGKATVLEIETTSYHKESGEALCMNRSTIYLRGAGGFSKSSPLYSYSKYPTNQVSRVNIPKYKPFAAYEECTHESQDTESENCWCLFLTTTGLRSGTEVLKTMVQALLYRLSGDHNPLHSDPTIARIAGFSRPILHGLCTLGFAVRAIIKCLGSGDPTIVKSILGRFLLHVYPGETLITEMWLENSRVLYQTKVRERNRTVLSGYVVLNHIPSLL
ncbi:enoyl-CoA hydratase 2, peroxisomal [Cinnamomum micranthum f. kanehirae]|uniref:Enoyl-CoA hydratase 2, peroxisomal n=1 Tax=Cinnamomum micranthum f. kanehirae TaxID=337451 RepID=A0A3S3NCG9_9MAGN|nr:enoyl-CoA hydratase 2, peroxisomal [Cinnamomum micranthum f. kanehirae]